MLRLYAFFHLNLMFSSIEEEQRPDVIARCYWPILDIAERRNLPLGIEATGFTLETIERLDPAWLEKCRELIGRDIIEPIGSGYTQMIGPLMPAELVRWNLKLGHKTYERLWGRRPRLALINEQAYSAGILPHYEEAGYEAVLMDWDMCAHIHPEWPSEWRYHPQIAHGSGASLPVVWTSSIVFQKLQRLAHGDLDLDEYLSLILARNAEKPRTLAVYSNDAECFDFRPGRFQAEAQLTKTGEWSVIEEAFARLASDERVAWTTPSKALTALPGENALNEVRLESPAFPIPVKKQLKYNASRWAVTGRASFDVNRRTRRIARALARSQVQDEAVWREACWLASSDIRTHITEKRFAAALERLGLLEAEAIQARSPLPDPHPRGGRGNRQLHLVKTPRTIEIVGPSLYARLNARRGLAIECFAAGHGAREFIGTVPHGAYDDLVHAFDWYSGTLVSDLVGRARVTDLSPVQPVIRETEDTISLDCEIGTTAGPLRKLITCDGVSLHYRYEIDWPASEKGSLRLGNFTLLPDSIDPGTLFFETHNGGTRPERFALASQTVDHGAPISFLVSASSGFGMTEGTLTIGDAHGRATITADDDSDAFLALITHRRVKDRTFCRVSLSASEMDDTRKPWRGSPRPLCVGFRIALSGGA